ncbi:MAG: nucleotidyltransferase [Flavobacterium sp. BFFFF2]|nr:MAG: nucleotidyltransferase [Flavobacterium sp. BFFFF2]
MNSIDTAFLERCIQTLQKAYMLLQNTDPQNIDYDMYRSACVKEFEIILEQCVKLLRKVLKPYFHSSKSVDQLFYKEVFKQCVLRSIISVELYERFLEYRDNRNSTAHDYGVHFAQETLLLLPQFIKDSTLIVASIKQQNNDHQREG